MVKGFRLLIKEVPITDVKKALALMRYRTTTPTVESLAYATISVCSRVLCISNNKTRNLLKEIIAENSPKPPRNQVETRADRRRNMP